MRKNALVTACLMAVAVAGGCSRSSEPARETPKEAAKEIPVAPESGGAYKVRMVTSKGPIVLEVHRDWAPIGAARFEELVKDKFYDGARFFRVVPNFVIQFGIAADPRMTKKWDKPIDDDPVRQTNRVGAVAFATSGPNTRTAQVFINLRSNQSLDGRGFAPFAQVIEGMDVVEKLYADYGEQPDQGQIERRGNAYLTKEFPQLDYIRSAAIM
jgi:cyclophilin family peptidyl-prolyl cis-trans isomerase